MSMRKGGSMRVCKCSANYGKECLFPEEYDTVGCTSGEGWWPIEDFYLDDEYGHKMNILEQEMLDGDDRD